MIGAMCWCLLRATVRVCYGVALKGDDYVMKWRSLRKQATTQPIWTTCIGSILGAAVLGLVGLIWLVLVAWLPGVWSWLLAVMIAAWTFAVHYWIALLGWILAAVGWFFAVSYYRVICEMAREIEDAGASKSPDAVDNPSEDLINGVVWRWEVGAAGYIVGLEGYCPRCDGTMMGDSLGFCMSCVNCNYVADNANRGRAELEICRRSRLNTGVVPYNQRA